MIEYIPATCHCYYYDFVLLSGLLHHTPCGGVEIPSRAARQRPAGGNEGARSNLQRTGGVIHALLRPHDGLLNFVPAADRQCSCQCVGRHGLRHGCALHHPGRLVGRLCGSFVLSPYDMGRAANCTGIPASGAGGPAVARSLRKGTRRMPVA